MSRQLLGQVFDQIRLHPLRSFLAVFGTMNGIMAVVMAVAIGQGSRMEIKRHFDELGANLLMVSSYASSGAPKAIPKIIKYTHKDVIRLKNSCLSVEEVAPFMEGDLEAQYRRRPLLRLRVIGTDTRYLKVRNLTMREGRFLSPLDLQLNRHVVVLNESAARLLIDSRYSRDDFKLFVGGTAVSVVGIVQDKTTEGFGQPVAYLPTTLYRRLIDVDFQNLMSIYVLVKESFTVEQAMEEVKLFLKGVHGPEAMESVESMTDFLVAFKEINRKAIWSLTAIASIILLSGGIGISNLLLASVRERTQEIGIRKAVGAKDRAILFQFVTEGVILSLLGGVLGVFLGIGVLPALLPALQLPVVIPYSAVVIGVIFSVVVGILSSYYPARTAAKLHPIEALRYE